MEKADNDSENHRNGVSYREGRVIDGAGRNWMKSRCESGVRGFSKESVRACARAHVPARTYNTRTWSRPAPGARRPRSSEHT